MGDFVDREVSPTGLITDIGFEGDKMLVRYTQDVEPLHRQNMNDRNDGDITKRGIQKDFVHVLSLTEVDCMRLITEDGIDPYTCHAKELKNHLYRHRDKWGHLFTTRGQF